jgi:hypothetical protein
MGDLFFLTVFAVFAALTAGLLLLCDRLAPGGKP